MLEPKEWWTSGVLSPDDIVVVGGRRRWVRAVDDLIMGRHRKGGVRFECPCCRYPTLRERGSYEICILCFWEDDGQDDPAADQVWGGPNYDYSLTEARKNFRSYLTQYRPEDSRHFERETVPEVLAIKRRIISAFEEMRTASGGNRLTELWTFVDSESAKLFEAK
jgi:hypothetical protein